MDESLPVPPLQFPSSSLPRRVNGYDRDATEEVFYKVVSSYATLWHEYSQLKGQFSEVQEQLGSLEEELARYKEEERLLGAVMIEANRSAAAMKEEARQEAEAIVNEAQSLVDTMVDEAQAQADKMMEDYFKYRSDHGDQTVIWRRAVWEYATGRPDAAASTRP